MHGYVDREKEVFLRRNEMEIRIGVGMEVKDIIMEQLMYEEGAYSSKARGRVDRITEILKIGEGKQCPCGLTAFSIKYRCKVEAIEIKETGLSSSSAGGYRVMPCSKRARAEVPSGGFSEANEDRWPWKFLDLKKRKSFLEHTKKNKEYDEVEREEEYKEEVAEAQESVDSEAGIRYSIAEAGLRVSSTDTFFGELFDLSYKTVEPIQGEAEPHKIIAHSTTNFVRNRPSYDCMSGVERLEHAISAKEHTRDGIEKQIKRWEDKIRSLRAEAREKEAMMSQQNDLESSFIVGQESSVTRARTRLKMMRRMKSILRRYLCRRDEIVNQIEEMKKEMKRVLKEEDDKANAAKMKQEELTRMAESFEALIRGQGPEFA